MKEYQNFKNILVESIGKLDLQQVTKENQLYVGAEFEYYPNMTSTSASSSTEEKKSDDDQERIDDLISNIANDLYRANQRYVEAVNNHDEEMRSHAENFYIDPIKEFVKFAKEQLKEMLKVSHNLKRESQQLTLPGFDDEEVYKKMKEKLQSFIDETKSVISYAEQIISDVEDMNSYEIYEHFNNMDASKDDDYYLTCLDAFFGIEETGILGKFFDFVEKNEIDLEDYTRPEEDASDEFEIDYNRLSRDVYEFESGDYDLYNPISTLMDISRRRNIDLFGEFYIYEYVEDFHRDSLGDANSLASEIVDAFVRNGDLDYLYDEIFNSSSSRSRGGFGDGLSYMRNEGKNKLPNFIKNHSKGIHFGGYHSGSGALDRFRLEEDSSLGSNGVELITPMMSVKEATEWIPKILDYIDKNGKTNEKCGLHITISHKTGKESQIDLLKFFWLISEKYIYNLMPDRKTTTYTRQIFKDVKRMLGKITDPDQAKEFIESHKNVLRSSEMKNVATGRHITMNLSNFGGNKTRIEIRAMGGRGYEKGDKRKGLITTLNSILVGFAKAFDPKYKEREYVRFIAKNLGLGDENSLQSKITRKGEEEKKKREQKEKERKEQLEKK